MSLAEGTRIATAEGWVPVENVGDPDVVPGQVNEITLVPASGRTSVSATVVCSRVQLFDLYNNGPNGTYDLRLGDVVKPSSVDFGYDDVHWLYGLLYGLHWGAGPVTLPDGLHFLRNKVDGIIAVSGPPSKPYRPAEGTAKEIGSWLKGFYQSKSNGRFVTTCPDAMNWVVDHAPFANVIAVSPIRFKRKPMTDKNKIIKEWLDTYEVTLESQSRVGGWKVEHIKVLTEKEAPAMFSYNPGAPYVVEGGIQIGKHEGAR